MSTLGDMLNLKFDSLFDFAEAFPNEEACIKYLEQLIWYGIPVSPFNRASKVYTCEMESTSVRKLKNTSR